MINLYNKLNFRLKNGHSFHANICEPCEAYFSYFTTFRHQTLQFCKFHRFRVGNFFAGLFIMQIVYYQLLQRIPDRNVLEAFNLT